MDESLFHNPTISQIAAAITAIGALGTASFGLVDASKIFHGLIPSSGFNFVERLIDELVPVCDGTSTIESALSRGEITSTLRANWINGKPLADQKIAAILLVKLRLNENTVAKLARVAGVNVHVLESAMKQIAGGHHMTQSEKRAYGQFDLLLTTLVGRAYENAEQRYVATAKLVSCLVALALTEAAAYCLGFLTPTPDGRLSSINLGIAAIAGLIATPLAPIAKDLANSLNLASKAIQSMK